MKINLDSAPDEAQIQIIPMIDVIFCILTFFILAALQLTRQQGINIDLPQASTGEVQMRQMLVVSIDAAGQTFVDQEAVDRSGLLARLQQYRTQNPDGLLVLNASQNAFYNDVIEVLDVLRAVGGDKVALATIPAPTITPTPINSPLGLPSDAPTSLFTVPPAATPQGDLPWLSPTQQPLTPQSPVVSPNQPLPSGP